MVWEEALEAAWPGWAWEGSEAPETIRPGSAANTKGVEISRRARQSISRVCVTICAPATSLCRRSRCWVELLGS